MRFEDLSRVFAESFEGRRQEIRLGSYALVERGPERDPSLSFTLTALVQLRAEPRADAQPKAVLAIEGERARSCCRSGRAAPRRASPDEKRSSELRLCGETPMKPGQWYRLWLSVDPASGRVVLGQQALDQTSSVVVRSQARGLALPSKAVCSSQRSARTRPFAISPERSRTRRFSAPSSMPFRARCRRCTSSAPSSSPDGIFPSASTRKRSPMSGHRRAMAGSSICRRARSSALAGAGARCAGGTPPKIMAPSISTTTISTIAAGNRASLGRFRPA